MDCSRAVYPHAILRRTGSVLNLGACLAGPAVSKSASWSKDPERRQSRGRISSSSRASLLHMKIAWCIIMHGIGASQFVVQGRWSRLHGRRIPTGGMYRTPCMNPVGGCERNSGRVSRAMSRLRAEGGQQGVIVEVNRSTGDVISSRRSSVSSCLVWAKVRWGRNDY